MKVVYDINELKELAKNSEKETKAFFAKLKKKKPKTLDKIVQEIHDEVFDIVDCLKCANCCSSISPMIKDHDIERMAKATKTRPSVFTSSYLKTDEDNDYVFKESPCPFLLPDKYCVIYDSRPKACREYPHTARKRFYQLLDLTIMNATICPAAWLIAEELKKREISL